jgi:hypothetical protein
MGYELTYMSSREFYHQSDLFSGELVDNRTAKQKRLAQGREMPRQAELFPQRVLAQFGVEAHPKLSLSPQSSLKLEIQDPRRPEEKEQDLKRLITDHTYPLPGLSTGVDRKVRLVAPGESELAEWRGLNQPPTYQDHEAFKQQYPEAIILYRLGDFFETFGEDAAKMAHELDLVLTSRMGENKQRIPMAGVPCHAADRYIARLLEKGYSVAICEPLQDEEDLDGTRRSHSQKNTELNTTGLF